MTQQRGEDEIRDDLAALLDELFPLGRDDEPNDADLSQGVGWWARTCIWWAKNCRSAWADREAARARVSELEQERHDLRRVKGTDYEVVAYDGEAHVARHYEATSWDSPPEAELMGSVGDLIRKLDETEPEVQRLRAVIDGPCGSCHPCTNYADETWRAAGRKPPHVYQWDELLARAERAEAQRDEALTLLADAVPDPKGAMDSPEWHRRMDALSGLSLQEEQE